MAVAQSDGLVFIDVTNEPDQFQVNDEQPEVVAAQKNADDVKAETTVPQTDLYEVIEDKFRCKLCLRLTTDDEDKMKRHIRKVHQGLNPFQCNHCEYSTYNSVLFQEHVNIHQGVKPYKCSFCPYRSVSKKNTKKHELVHRPNNPLRCTECDYYARHKRALQCHMLEKHGYSKKGSKKEDDFKCANCNIMFVQYWTYKNHRKSRKKCSLCDKVVCRQNMTTHKLEHGDSVLRLLLEKPRKSSRVKKLFTCAICNWGGSHKPKILLHLIHHPNQDLSDCKVDLSLLRNCGILPAENTDSLQVQSG